jgi:hypothetical protein
MMMIYMEGKWNVHNWIKSERTGQREQSAIYLGLLGKKHRFVTHVLDQAILWVLKINN